MLTEVDVAALRRRYAWFIENAGAVTLPASLMVEILAALEHAERVEKAAQKVRYEIERMLELECVPQLTQIRWWSDHLAAALEGRNA